MKARINSIWRLNIGLFSLCLFFNSISLGQEKSLAIKNTYVLTSLSEQDVFSLKQNKHIDLFKKIFTNPDIYKIETRLSKDEVKKLAPKTNIRHTVTLEDRSMPDDPLFFDQWHLDKIQATEAWNISTGGPMKNGKQPVVVIFDRGVEMNHLDLEENFTFNPGEIPNDFIDNDQNGYVDDYYGLNLSSGNDKHGVKVHGTAVMGAAFARGDNDEGIAGISWEQPVFYLSKSAGPLQDVHYIEAFNYIRDLRKKYNESNGKEGMYIVVSSVSSGIFKQKAEDFPDWCAVYDAMGEEGILSIVATENTTADVDETGDMPTVCPSDYIIAVTASDKEDKLQNVAYGSISVDIAAPGKTILTTTPENKYSSSLSGTSLATPIVAGAVSLTYSAASQALVDEIDEDPSKGALIIKDIILSQVDKIEDLKQKLSSGGRLNLFNSVQYSANWVKEVKRTFDIISFDQDGLLTYRIDEEKQSDITIFNVIGQKVFQTTIEPCPQGFCSINLPISQWAKGTYVLQVELDGKTLDQSLVIP